MGKKQTELQLNAALCRHAYSTSVESLARLASYTTSRSLRSIGYGEYYSVAEELCKSDIINLSISIRRLSELTKTQTLLKKKYIEIISIIPKQDDDSSSFKKSDSCWNILGNVIHGIDMDVTKNIGVKLYTFGYETDFLKAAENKDEIDTVLSIKSDKYHRKMFKLLDLCVKINESIEEINDVMSDNGVFLGSIYN